MKYSKATNYALHTLVYMAKVQGKENLSVQKIAEQFNVSQTYLSKILTQLVKGGFIESTSGVKGGYSLRKEAEKISFLEVIQVVEGKNAFFQCEFKEERCAIHQVMAEAEHLMESYLAEKSISDIIK